jgi:hypothetical protein
MEGLFFLAMLTSIGACVAVAYDIIKQFNHGEFDSVLKRNADFDAAQNFKVSERTDDSINVVLMRADELEILP